MKKFFALLLILSIIYGFAQIRVDYTDHSWNYSYCGYSFALRNFNKHNECYSRMYGKNIEIMYDYSNHNIIGFSVLWRRADAI